MDPRPPERPASEWEPSPLASALPPDVEANLEPIKTVVTGSANSSSRITAPVHRDRLIPKEEHVSKRRRI
jgi:hypothetical protein